MKITTKGQVTIPQKIRDKYGLFPNTDVNFIERNGRVVLEKCEQAPSRGRRLLKKITGRSEVKMTTREIMKLTRGE